MAVGGDIVEVTWNHPTLGSGVIVPKANEDNSYEPGGIQTEDDADAVDGSGNPIWKLNRKLGYFQLVATNNQNTGQELEKMRALQADPVPTEWTFSIINGTVYGGTGKPVGELVGNINQATFPLKVNSSQFKKIVG
jgi:hypothetical protein